MAEASGWGVLPLSVSFSGIYKDLQKQLVEPATKAGKTAGQAVASEMKSGAEAAAKAVESAQYRQKKSSEELRAAESKLTEQKLKSEAANQAVEAAARKRSDAESKGIDAIEKAEQDLLKKRANAEKAARDMASAEQKVEDALGKSARAAENLEQKQRALDAAQDDTEQSAGKLSGRLKEMGDEADSTGGLFDGLTGKVGGFVGAFAGIAGVGALLAEGMDVSGQVDKMNRQLGLVGDEAEQMGEDVTAVMKSGWGAEEAVSAIGSLTSQFDNLGVEGEQTARDLSDNFLAFADTFEVDMAEATQMAGQLVKNGLAGDAEEAADLMTKAFQSVPAAMRDELPDLLNEYGTFFSSMGYSGEETLSMFVGLSDEGAIAMDKLGDAIKETGIRATDLGDTGAVEALEDIGLAGEDIPNRLLAGGETARVAMEQMADALLGVEDPAERAAHAAALIGTPIEDLNKAGGLDPFLESLKGAGTEMEGFAGSSQALSDQIGESLEGRMATLKGTVSALATEGFMWLWDVTENKVIPTLKDVGTWIQDNEKWIAPLAATIGGAAAAWGLWTAAVKGWEFATKVATGVQMAFNLVMNANPIMLIVTALAAVTAGLIYFFTQTETGREMWGKFTGALVDGWDWVSEKVGGGIDWIQEKFEKFTGWISDAWSGITSLFKGDFTSSMREAFGVEEDNPLISGFLKVHEILTGIPDLITGIGDILFKGDYAGLPFGLEEDSGLVGFLFGVRDAISGTITWVQDAWAWLGDTMSATYNNIIKPVFDGFINVGKILLAVIGTAVLAPLLISWNFLSWGMNAAWENIIKPVFDGFAAVGMWLWNEVLSPAFTWIGDKWTAMSAVLSAVWETIKSAVFDAFGRKMLELEIWWKNTTGKLAADWQTLKDMFSAIWETIKTAVFDAWNSYVNQVQANWDMVTTAITNAWTWLKDTFASVWETIRTAVFDAWNSNVLNVRGTFEGVTASISEKWNWLKDGLAAGWNWIRDNVFTKFEQGIDSLKSFFSTTVDGIRDVWAKLRGYLASPINFMIDTVWNNGIAEAWDTIAEVLPVEPKKAKRLGRIPEYAVGGGVHGPGTGTSDDILAKLSNGEHVWTAKEVREAGGQRNVYAMRNLVKAGQPFSFDGQGSLTPLPRNPDNRAGDLAGAAPDLLPRFATGGEVRPLWETQLERAHEFASAQHGKPYQWAGPTGPETSFDCSGYMGSIAAVLQDTSPWQRYWATMSFGGGNTAQGFVPGLGPGFSIGLFNGGPYGGHVAGTLGAAGNYGTTNVESGGSPSMVKYGVGAVGADHSQFTHQYHLPIGADGAFESGGAGGFDFMGAVSKWIGDKMSSLLDPIVEKLPSPPPAWQDIPRGFFEKGKDSLFGFVEEKIENLGHLVSGVWGKITNLFDTGGMLQSGRMAMNLSGKPERILSPSQTIGFDNLVRNLPLVTESMAVIAEEIGQAFHGGDWGYGELAHVIGSEQVAKAIVDGAAALGVFTREMGPQVQKSGADYLTAQGSSALDVVGLGGLVPLGLGLGQRAADLAALSPVQARLTSSGVVVEIDAEGGDFVHVDRVKALEAQVHGLTVNVNRRPAAASVTRGGVM